MQPQDWQYCLEKATQSGSSFLAAFRLLPKKKRQAITVLYAYCRELDDVTDTGSHPEVSRPVLAWWREELAAAFHGTPQHPVLRAMVPWIQRFGLPEEELAGIIDGVSMDIEPQIFPDFARLQRYCQGVAGDVGRLLVRILGFEHDQTLAYADQMGLALQLTNIIRDVGEDARNGRVYLPADELAAYGLNAHDLLTLQGGAGFADFMAMQIQRAKQTYRQALALLPRDDAKKQRAGLAMAAIYYALLREIEKDGGANVLRHKISLPNIRKIAIATRVGLLGWQA